MLLEASNLHKRYNHSTAVLHVLKGVSLKIDRGDVLAIVGPSGAGKSTLLHILGGLDRPSEGNVFLEGQNIYLKNDRERSNMRNDKVGFVFQFYHLLPEFTALENVILPALVQKNLDVPESLKAKGTELLTRVGLAARVSHKPYQLSGGEQQRVAIARALMNDPAIVFCDEPTGNLDSENGAVVIQMLLELSEKNQQTLVIVTHDEAIARRAKRTLQMRDGKFI